MPAHVVGVGADHAQQQHVCCADSQAQATGNRQQQQYKVVLAWRAIPASSKPVYYVAYAQHNSSDAGSRASQFTLLNMQSLFWRMI